MATTHELTATLSGTSFPPYLAIEGREVGMWYDNGSKTWIWSDDAVPVEGDLDVTMMAQGWNGATVHLLITCDAKGVLDENRTISKGYVTLEKSIPLTAATTP